MLLNIKGMRTLFLSLIIITSILLLKLPLRAEKIRSIVTTDGEVDDRLSIHRFLLYANEWDIEGLIYTSSRYHWKYPSAHKWNGTNWIEETINEYAKVQSNLKKHAKGYPTENELLQKVKVGNIHKPEMTYVGKDFDTEGSTFIKEILLDSTNDRKVYIQAWGGTIAIAQALWRIKTSHPSEIERISAKTVIFNTGNQDSQDDKNCSEWIIKSFPDIQYIRSMYQYKPIGYKKWIQETNPYFDHYVYSPEALNAELKTNHGPLMANMSGCKFCEGDNVCFYYLIPNGLNGYEYPSYGSWGGRYKKEQANYFTDAKDDGNIYKPVWRWTLDFQTDFFARADWCIESYEEANHNPVMVEFPEKIIKAGSKGTKVQLNALAKDPDGDNLSYSWWHYKGPSSYQGELQIVDGNTKKASFKVPTDKQKNVHIILEVQDDGKHNLKTYQRVIVQFNEI